MRLLAQLQTVLRVLLVVLEQKQLLLAQSKQKEDLRIKPIITTIEILISSNLLSLPICIKIPQTLMMTFFRLQIN
jgi:hypothetical protein